MNDLAAIRAMCEKNSKSLKGAADRNEMEWIISVSYLSGMSKTISQLCDEVERLRSEVDGLKDHIAELNGKYSPGGDGH